MQSVWWSNGIQFKHGTLKEATSRIKQWINYIFCDVFGMESKEIK